MSIIHLRQIRAHLEENFDGLIDMTDMGKNSAEEQKSAFLSRALAAYSVKITAEVNFSDAAACVTDGFGDNGIDAVYYSSSERILYIVQSKWSQDGTGSISAGDLQKFIQGFRDLINARLDRFNDKLRKHKEKIDSALNAAQTRLIMIVAYSGTQPLAPAVQTLLDDLVIETNDTSEVLIAKVLRQANIYAAVARGAEAQPIDLEIALHSWGQVREPYLAYYGQVAAHDVAVWWTSHFPQIFSTNIRIYLGSTDINEGIAETIKENPDKFWYFNNGITALCANIIKKPIGGTNRDMGIFECHDFRIVNGAQTVGSIAVAAERSRDEVQQAKVPIRIISLAETPEAFAREITKHNNTQNRIERRDFVALDDNQERLRNELLLENISYVYKSGESVPAGGEGFDLVEATVALACAHRVSSHAVQAKREIGRLWDDITKAPYRALFNDAINGPQLWRKVLILRQIESQLSNIIKAEDGRRKLCAIHGNRLIAHIVFKGLPDSFLDDFGHPTEDEVEEIIKQTSTGHANVFAAIENNFADSYPASLFKNQTKCAQIIDIVG